MGLIRGCTKKLLERSKVNHGSCGEGRCCGTRALGKRSTQVNTLLRENGEGGREPGGLGAKYGISTSFPHWTRKELRLAGQGRSNSCGQPLVGSGGA